MTQWSPAFIVRARARARVRVRVRVEGWGEGFGFGFGFGFGLRVRVRVRVRVRPAFIVPAMTEMVAAMPVLKHAAPYPSSSLAILFSSVVT